LLVRLSINSLDFSPGTSDGSNTYPVVPRAVSIAGLVQNILSAVLIFLLLLGVRNLLKLK